MELFDYFRSSAAYRIRIALNLKSIPYTKTAINLLTEDHKSAEYKALNHQGLVPTLKLDDGRLITQSTAILEYLEAVYPDVPLLPTDPFEAARIRSMCNLIACDIHPVNNLRVLKYLTGTLGLTEEDKLTWYHHWIKEGFDAFEPQIGEGPFAAGNAVTLADVYLVPQVFNALRFGLDMSPYPKIMRSYDDCHMKSEFIDAAPEAS